METWTVNDGMGEWLEYHNCTNNIMHFTRDSAKKLVTTDSEHAFEMARLARQLYGRKYMRMAMVND